MQVVKRLDAGDMLARSFREIGENETSDVVERALAEDGARLLLDVLDRIEAGHLQAEPQEESSATYAARLTKHEGLIDWSLPASVIHNRVRGLYPWPHAYSYLGGARVIVLKTQVRPKADKTSEPGMIVSVTADAIDVATGAGVLAIHELQPEGRRPMQAREFLAGRDVHVGSRFGDQP